MRIGTRIQRYEVTACDVATAADVREYAGPARLDAWPAEAEPAGRPRYE